MKKANKVYLCESCGNDFTQWSGRCTICGEWNSLKEITVPDGSSVSKNIKDVEVSKLSEISVGKNERIKTGIGEFDRVLGGGIVPGSLILVGGEPGIGKSTLLLQICNTIKNSFYISAEESLGQIKGRSDRLKINPDGLKLIADGDLLSIEKEILKP